MQPRTLFLLGLVVGGLAVFGVRAITHTEAAPSTSPGDHAPKASAPATVPAPSHEDHAASREPENRICPVMGNPVDPKVFVDYEGRRIGFCCPGCDTAFLENPEKYLKKVDAEIAARDEPAEGPAKPGVGALDPDRPPENEICPVMGNPVDPEVYVDHEGRRIGFCCPGCDTLFLEDPAKYLKKVDAELAKRGGGAPHAERHEAEDDPDPDRPPENRICPVMGNPVDPEVFVDHEGRRIGFCCPGCDKVFLEDPAKYLKKVDAEIRKRGEK